MKAVLSIFVALLVRFVDFNFAADVEITIERPGIQSRDSSDPEFEWLVRRGKIIVFGGGIVEKCLLKNHALCSVGHRRL